MNALIRCLACASLALTLGITSQSVVQGVRYRASYGPINSPQFFSGNMVMNFNRGIITGRYDDTSVKPGGPLSNRRNVPISGGVGDLGAITLVIGPLSVHNGSFVGTTISGTARFRGSTLTFRAHQTSPGTTSTP